MSEEKLIIKKSTLQTLINNYRAAMYLTQPIKIGELDQIFEYKPITVDFLIETTYGNLTSVAFYTQKIPTVQKPNTNTYQNTALGGTVLTINTDFPMESLGISCDNCTLILKDTHTILVELDSNSDDMAKITIS